MSYTIGQKVFFTGRPLHAAVEPATIEDVDGSVIALRLDGGELRLEPIASRCVHADETQALANAYHVLHRLAIATATRALRVAAFRDELMGKAAAVWAELKGRHDAATLPEATEPHKP